VKWNAARRAPSQDKPPFGLSLSKPARFGCANRTRLMPNFSINQGNGQ